MKTLHETLLGRIDTDVNTNGSGAITGAILNSLLKAMGNNLNGSSFTYAASEDLTESDIGKVVMDNGSGEAVVYALSPAQDPKLGRWVLRLNDLDNLSSSSQININWDGGGHSFNRSTWRDGETPTTPLEELELIKAYIDGESSLSNLSTSFDDEDLIIEESSFLQTSITLNNFTGDTLPSYIDTVSTPALPASPTKFPLGKLVGLEDGLAIISSNLVETYSLDGSYTVNFDFFDYLNDIDLVNEESIINVLDFLVEPTNDGKVRKFSVDAILLTEDFALKCVNHFVGIALRTDGSTVTVLNANQLSLVVSLFVKFIYKANFFN